MIAAARGFARILWQALRHYTQDHGANHAAAVAYFSLLSLGPGLLLTGRLLHRFLPDAGGIEAALRALGSFLPPEVAPTLGALGKSLAAGGALVAVAIPALAWVASHAFSALEIAVNVAFGTTPQRRFLLSRLKAFAGLSGAVVLLGGTLVATHVATWLDGYRREIGGPSILSPRAHVVSAIALVAVTFVVFTLFYKLLPRGRVRWGAAARAAIVAVALWEGARHLFGALLAKSPAFGMFTGAIAGIVAFLGWIYVAVAVTIYGAEVAAILNGNRGGSAGSGLS
jgi:membrane protein